jgi:hypothetical protein
MGISTTPRIGFSTVRFSASSVAGMMIADAPRNGAALIG